MVTVGFDSFPSLAKRNRLWVALCWIWHFATTEEGVNYQDSPASQDPMSFINCVR
jgi:hypothetical protein